MLKISLLEKDASHGREIYRATDKGLDFLQRYREINELLKREDNGYRNDVKVPPPHLLKRN
jgi:DNA-binding PadR family transcriptional regulator